MANRSDADVKARVEAASRASAEAAAKARSDADVKARAEAASRASAEAAAKARTETPAVNPSALFQQAQALEQTSVREAIKRYEEAGNAGYGPASKRLGEIYVVGAGNVGRDYVKSVKWYGKARDQGMPIQEKE